MTHTHKRELGEGGERGNRLTRESHKGGNGRCGQLTGGGGGQVCWAFATSSGLVARGWHAIREPIAGRVHARVAVGRRRWVIACMRRVHAPIHPIVKHGRRWRVEVAVAPWQGRRRVVAWRRVEISARVRGRGRIQICGARVPGRGGGGGGRRGGHARGLWGGGRNPAHRHRLQPLLLPLLPAMVPVLHIVVRPVCREGDRGRGADRGERGKGGRALLPHKTKKGEPAHTAVLSLSHTHTPRNTQTGTHAFSQRHTHTHLPGSSFAMRAQRLP